MLTTAARNLVAIIMGSFALTPLPTAAQQPSGPAASLLLVANKTDRTLGLIDPILRKQIAIVQEQGVTGHEVAASIDGKMAYVPIYGDSGVGKPGSDGRLMRVIDLRKREIIDTVDFGKGVRPHCVVTCAARNCLFVTTELENSVTVLDAVSLKAIGTIPTGQAESHMLAVTRDGARGYTANVGTGTISALDLASRKLLKVIQVADRVQRIALSADDRLVFTSDQDRPRLAAVDCQTLAISRWIDLPGIGYGAAVTPDNRWLVIALPGKRAVAILDLQTMQIAKTLDVPKAPQEVVIRPDGLEAYVSCDSAGKVAVIDLRHQHVDDLIDAGAGADGLAWAQGR